MNTAVEDPSIDPDPAATYRTRMNLRIQTERALRARSDRISSIRVWTFLVGATAGVLLLAEIGSTIVLYTLIVAAVVAFVTLVVIHERVERACDRAHEAVTYYERGLQRIADPRIDTGAIGRDYAPPTHPYAADLDLFGAGSMFSLLCTARTRTGQQVLANWLCAPASLSEIEVRHAALRGLRVNLDLREDLDLLGGPVGATVDPTHLIAWGEAPQRLPDTWQVRGLLWLCTIGALATFYLWVADTPYPIGPFPFLIVVACEGLIYRHFREPLSRLSAPLGGITKKLATLQSLLHRVEEEPPATPRLRALRRALTVDSLRASVQIAKLRRLVDWFEARHNALLAPILFCLMWPLHFAIALERWRGLAGPALQRWLTNLGEYEALCAISGYAYEHPQDPLPELVSNGPVLEGKHVGHPLLPRNDCICNDITFGTECSARIVSGSNMSGKSTYLRSVGLNVVLALTGLPVRARSFRLSPLRVGATLRVEDNLREGASRFYAELQRLQTVVELSQQHPPLLFLLDEIFHGTNSHDRQLGAKGLLKGLLDAGAIGLMTTHDLALTQLANTLPGQVKNVHFTDELRDGKLHFDYRMREGVVTKSNALELMRALGLPVDPATDIPPESPNSSSPVAKTGQN